MKNEKEYEFGPFLLTSEQFGDVKSTGMKCLDCRKHIKRYAIVVPGMVVRMVFYNCRCGTVCVWEDEAQPATSQSLWQLNMKLLRLRGVKMLIFNGDNPLKPDFSGLS